MSEKLQVRAYTAGQIASMWGISAKTVHRLMNTGALPFFSPGGRQKLVRVADLEEYERNAVLKNSA